MTIKSIEVNPIMTKARKRFGQMYAPQPTEYAAGIVNPGKPNATISLVCTNGHAKGTGRSFSIGDIAEYHSYNLSYTGMVVSITAKTVTIAEKHDSSIRHRLDLHHFAWRNYNFDAASTARENADTMMYI